MGRRCALSFFYERGAGEKSMKFVKTEDLKIGMRLARPIYNNKGVLLYERDSQLSSAAIASIQNFNLLGIYILDPAEPLPPMTEKDLEFERFQVMTNFAIQEELDSILQTGKYQKMHLIANMIVKNYGHLIEKVNFYQNLRSREDFVCRHSLNVAIFCALMTHVMNVRSEEQQLIVIAAMVHDIGRMKLASELKYRDDWTDEEKKELYSLQSGTDSLIEGAFSSDGITIRRICAQARRKECSFEEDANVRYVTGAKVLCVANRYDELTAMSLGGESKSEVKALKELMAHPDIYEPTVVEALVQSINILSSGVGVVLNTGERALVLRENMDNILRPVVLSFRDNSIVDLSLAVNQDLEVEDIMKTLDNRCFMDESTIKQVGIDKI